MSDHYLLSRSVRGTALEEGGFYTFEELVDAANPEIADFLVMQNVAIKVRDEYVPQKAEPPAEPVKRGRGRPRKDSYTTRDMRAK